MSLTYKQRLFVEAYLGVAGGNASEAARIAGYCNPGQAGHDTLKKHEIQAAIDARLADAAMPANEILARLSEIASGDLGFFLSIDNSGEWKVDLKRAKKASKTKLLRKIKAGKDGPEIEIHNPVDALKQLGLYHGLWTGEASKGKAMNRRQIVQEAKKRAEDRRRNRGSD